MKSPSEVTILDPVNWALKQDPTQINPTNPQSSCLYTGPDGTHCIAGQFFVDHGIPTNNLIENENADKLAYLFGFQKDVAVALQRAQQIADTAALYGRSWSKALRFLSSLGKP